MLLVSCYELGRPPTGLASPLAWLKGAGYAPEVLDLAVDSFDPIKAKAACFVAISVPMHTALRLGVRAAANIRKQNPACHICFHGLYAFLNAEHLLGSVADSVIGGESEGPLLRLIQSLEAGQKTAVDGVSRPGRIVPPYLRRPNFRVPDRAALPPLEKYARLEVAQTTRLAGYAEASRGCKHVCRHCPITPVYGGRFFIVPEDVVLEDIGRQVEAGASHISFGDPDFLNGPGHALRVVRALAKRHPGLTFDFTAKVEHILKERALFPEFSQSGCLFVISAVESLSDIVLGHLAKGHTRADVYEAFSILKKAGIALRPSLVSFTPWTTLEDFFEVLDFVEREGLVYAVDPVHYAIRLLLPPGSPLAELPAMKPHLGPLNSASFSYSWSHPDARLDRLQQDVMRVVSRAAKEGEDAALTLARIQELALALRDHRKPKEIVAPVQSSSNKAPRLTESWFCCAEPTEEHYNQA